jgi:tetratricopeptide (TPR) repeat protein
VNADWDQYKTLGEQLLKEGDYAAAEIMWRAAYEQAKDFNKLDARVHITLEGLSEALFHQGKFDEAEPLCRQTIDIFTTLRGPEHPDVGVTTSNLAMLLKAQGKHSEAEALYQSSLNILTAALGPDHSDVMNLKVHFAESLRAQGKDKAADELKVGSVSGESAHLTRSGQFDALPIEKSDTLFEPRPATTVSPEAAQEWERNRQMALDAFRRGDMQGAEFRRDRQTVVHIPGRACQRPLERRQVQGSRTALRTNSEHLGEYAWQ